MASIRRGFSLNHNYVMTRKLSVLPDICEGGNPPVTGGFPSQKASDTESVVIPANTGRNTNVNITSKRRCDVVLT